MAHVIWMGKTINTLRSNGDTWRKQTIWKTLAQMRG